ncbi:hypothetical protein D0Z67_08165 [Streptomyces seoulensis]|uniref:DUF8094 domain-containing protein n=1 Tax=Streptomyces seoulensis TaxID=73044 RepID=A0A4P6TU03_STRSO|nr:hypothetical protein [Streptomyces seoulensis]QBJ90287.1 hypothetical protein D0Z67_08165 [Streptomyces seoulensis]
MSRDRSGRGPRGRNRRARTAASLAVCAVMTSGCVVVHGEREVLPAASRPEAARALARFTDAYNRADRAYDSSLDAGYVTGAFGAIDSARLRAGHANNPGGNSRHTPLTLTDAKYTIPAKAGWPRWFVVNAKGNKGGSARWLMVFVRDDLGEAWRVAYLTLVPAGQVPDFRVGADGWAEAVPGEDLSARYAAYLRDGGKTFADGPSTSNWRAVRAQQARKPGLVRQYIDEPLTRDAFAPLALRTADGGALVFFASHHYEKRTAAAGTSVTVPNRDVQALTKGEVKQSLTLEFISNQAALDPPGGGPVSILGRVQGLTAAQGE